MMPDATSELILLRQEVAALRESNQKLVEQIKLLTEESERLKQHNHVMKLKVDALARRLFGKSSEKLDPAQLQMVFEALERGGGAEGRRHQPCLSAGKFHNYEFSPDISPREADCCQTLSES